MTCGSRFRSRRRPGFQSAEQTVAVSVEAHEGRTHVQRVLQRSQVALKKPTRGGNVKIGAKPVNMCQHRVATLRNTKQPQSRSELRVRRLRDVNLLENLRQRIGVHNHSPRVSVAGLFLGRAGRGQAASVSMESPSQHPRNAGVAYLPGHFRLPEDLGSRLGSSQRFSLHLPSVSLRTGLELEPWCMR